jgi:hypothetical protein
MTLDWRNSGDANITQMAAGIAAVLSISGLSAALLAGPSLANGAPRAPHGRGHPEPHLGGSVTCNPSRICTADFRVSVRGTQETTSDLTRQGGPPMGCYGQTTYGGAGREEIAFAALDSSRRQT